MQIHLSSVVGWRGGCLSVENQALVDWLASMSKFCRKTFVLGVPSWDPPNVHKKKIHNSVVEKRVPFTQMKYLKIEADFVFNCSWSWIWSWIGPGEFSVENVANKIFGVLNESFLRDLTKIELKFF